MDDKIPNLALNDSTPEKCVSAPSYAHNACHDIVYNKRTRL